MSVFDHATWEAETAGMSKPVRPSQASQTLIALLALAALAGVDLAAPRPRKETK